MSLIQRILNTTNTQKDLSPQIGLMANSINALENQVLVLKQKTELLEEDLRCANNSILYLHEPLKHSSEYKRELIADPTYDISEVYKLMESKAPKSYKIYRELMKNGESEYRDKPVGSCSIEGDIESIKFSKFMSRYIHGNVLDIGCGPEEIPLYLKGYPLDRIYGIDPLLPHTDHPFSFVQGLAEILPWEDESFDIEIFGTSFDHIFLVDLVMKEIWRVLKQDGYILMWVSFVEDAEEYNPYSENFIPYDRFHMFHTTKQNFEELVSNRFCIIDYYKSNINSHFYALKKG